MSTIFTPVRILLLAVLAVAIVAGLILIPPGTELPVHWGLSGEADGFMPREWALAMPVLILAVVWAILLIVMRFASPEKRQAGAAMIGAALTAVTAIIVAIAVATVAIGTGAAVSMVHVVAVAMGLLLILLGNAMPKSQPNGFAGLRIPTTLKSSANWQATHRVTGWLTMAGGLVLLAAVFVIPAGEVIWWVLGCVLVPLVAGSIYSIAIARRAA